jgi:hypothetical protein
MQISSVLNSNIGLPYELFSIRSIAPNIGISTADSKRMPVSRKTIGDYLLYFFITISSSFIPM